MVIARLFFPLTLGACLIISIIHRNFNKIQVTKITNKHHNRSSLQVAWKRIIKAMKKNSTKNTFWCKLFSFIHIAKQTVKDQQYRTPTVQAYQEPILDYVIELKTIHGCIVKQMSFEYRFTKSHRAALINQSRFMMAVPCSNKKNSKTKHSH